MMLNQEKVEKLLKQNNISDINAFEILQFICFLANQSLDNSDSIAQSFLLKVLDKRNQFDSYKEIINGLIRRFGLYPYLDTEILTVKDAIAREIHRPQLLSSKPENDFNNDGKDFVFHRVQAEVFRYLLEGDNIILSAPTSFGKSAIIDALVESENFDNLVIILPTIALIDETRRRLASLRSDHKIITHSTQTISEKNIFIFTQERVVEYPDFPSLDLFILDEFYKLDPRQDAERAMTLNHAFYKLTKKSKQFYLLGPNIDEIPDGFSKRFQCRFIRTDFATVVTELIPVKHEKGRHSEMGALIELCHKLVHDSTLIFCSSPAKARYITLMLAKSLETRHAMFDAASWVAENYHAEWTFVKGLNKGIGIHHGKIPRALAQLCVKGFNEGTLPFLVCTSTLIEGVNTKAKNIIIFDNTIAKNKYDYFTFNNIRGRSGRMFQHFIGNVYLFHEQPEQKLPLVDIPVFSQNENTYESLLVQLDEKDLSDLSKNRLSKYYSKSNILSLETIKQNAGIEPNDQINLAQHLLESENTVIQLAWGKHPSYEELQFLCKKIWDYFINQSGQIYGISSGKQLAFKVNQFRVNTLDYIIQEEIREQGKLPDDAIEDNLAFVGQWLQFKFPKLAMGVCRIQNEIARGLNYPLADYSFFCCEVENLFSDSALVALDEYGLPFPLAKKLEKNLRSDGKLDDALENLSTLDLDKISLTNFEKKLIQDVIQSI